MQTLKTCGNPPTYVEYQGSVHFISLFSLLKLVHAAVVMLLMLVLMGFCGTQPPLKAAHELASGFRRRSGIRSRFALVTTARRAGVAAVLVDMLAAIRV